ncbi:MAG: NDP-sugar synthase [Methanomassiliicoccaceae archaeon]|nr:NDP-sugar synthase [Methanomassiliicoccaceae archaeon]
MEEVRQAVIVVGGHGTRLRPLTNHRPKPVLPVLDKPCLMYLIESMAGSGIEEVVLACGYRSSQLEEAIGDGSGMGVSIVYSYEDAPLGSAGAMKNAESRLDDVFVAANGDVFADISLKEQVQAHFASGAEATIALTRVDDVTQYGIATLDGDDRVTGFIEKPESRELAPTDLGNAGVYVINKTALSNVPEGSFFDFSKDLLPILLRGQKGIQGFFLKGMWRDVGRPADLLGANMDMASKLYGHMSWGGDRVESTVVRRPFYLGYGASVTRSEVSAAVVMEGSSVTGSRLTNAVVMGGCKVSSARIENSIIGPGCRICPGAEVISSVIEDGLTIEAGRRVEDGTV